MDPIQITDFKLWMPPLERSAPEGPGGGVGRSFAELLRETSAEAREAARSAERHLATGEGELHQVLLGLGKADLSFRLLLEVRNKLTEAYQELSRMQI